MLRLFDKYLNNLITKKLADKQCNCQQPTEEQKINKRTFVKKGKLKNNAPLDHNEYLKRTSITWGVLANYIAELRINAKINQRKLAKKLNISPAQVSRLELGKVALTIEMAEILDEIFNVNIKKLWDFPFFKEEECKKLDEPYKITFGKFTGKTAAELPRHYAIWLRENGTFKDGKNRELYDELIKAHKL